MINYFSECATFDQLKQQYRKLAMKHHPHKGGDAEIFKDIVNQYERAINYMAAHGENNGGPKPTEEERKAKIMENEKYMSAVNAVINIEGIFIEVVGTWIWITGNTKPVKTELSAAGFLWASLKKAWYFRTEENKVKSYKKGQTLDDIKNKYGAQTIKNNYNTGNRLNAA